MALPFSSSFPLSKGVCTRAPLKCSPFVSEPVQRTREATVYAKRINQSDIGRRIGLKMGMSEEQGIEVTKVVLRELKSAVLDGEEVCLTGFGTLSSKTRAPRMTRNPRTGESFQTPEKTFPSERPPYEGPCGEDPKRTTTAREKQTGEVSMGDVYDVLGFQKGGDRPEGSNKPKEAKAKRPEGMSREAFSLLDGSHPIMQSELARGLMRKGELASRKRKGEGSYHVVYRWKKFKNQARQDGLELSHWVKCYKDAQGNAREAERGDYPFAKFNKKVGICQYNDDEYEKVIAPISEGWSKEETDYLLDMCGTFDIRFVVITDRYNFPNGPDRTLEELKSRYYSIARNLLVYREGSEEAIANHLLVKHPYNLEAERLRRNACDSMFKKTGKQEQEDTQVLEEAQKIEERRKHEWNARKVASANVSAFFCHPDTFDDDLPQGEPSLFDYDLKPFKPAPGIYVRGHHTREIAKQQLVRMGGQGREQKLVENTIKDVGCTGYPRIAKRSQAGAFLALHAEVINLVETRRRPNN